MKKTAAVYDRWLHTLGGGEQLAFSYAEALRELGYKTTMLTHRPVDAKEAVRKMNVDLTDITIEYLPNLPDKQLSSYTEKYDVFVNNSYLDYIPNLSRFGILSIFFPSKIDMSLYEYLKRAYIIPSLRNFFIYPTELEGFQYDEYKKGMLHKWLSKESYIYFNKKYPEIHITLYMEHLVFSYLDMITFHIDDVALIPSSRTINRHSNTIQYTFNFGEEQGRKFAITLPETDFKPKTSLVSYTIPSVKYQLYNVFKWLFPKYEMRLHGGPSITTYSDIESYDAITTISSFSATWIRKFWKMGSIVLFPPVNTSKFSPSKKKVNTILNVGRFFVGGHCKKQLDLVRFFKILYDRGYTDWKLQLVGSLEPGEVHRKYLETIYEEIEDYPVQVVLNPPFSELKDIFEQSKIYWHATGYNESDPMNMEHFGITTVEAMACGCVPVVINKGGQTEIIDKAGFTWNTHTELLEHTEYLINNPHILEHLTTEAVKRSTFFSKARFIEQLRTLLPIE